jgi:hypothetical protein
VQDIGQLPYIEGCLPRELSPFLSRRGRGAEGDRQRTRCGCEGLPRPGHAPDYAVFLLEEKRVGQDPVPFKPNPEFARALDFDSYLERLRPANGRMDVAAMLL